MRKKYFDPILTLVFIAIFGLFGVCIPLLIFNGLLSSSDYLTLVGYFLSWPVATTVLGLIFLLNFREPISWFLQNVRSVEALGAKIQARDPDSMSNLDGADEEPEVVTPELENAIQSLLRERKVFSEEKDELIEEINRAYAIAYEWKFKYLEIFLVPVTKQVLLWFSNVGTTFRKTYTEEWRYSIPDVSQRDVILDTLIFNGLITVNGLQLSISNVGYAFLQHIGSIPRNPLPNQTSG